MQDKSLQIVSYEQAQKLKKLGFEWEVQHYYDLTFGLFNYEGKPNHNFNDNTATISAPTIALALKWFRDERGIPNGISVIDNGEYALFLSEYIENYVSSDDSIDDEGNDVNTKVVCLDMPDVTYEECESALLDKLIELEMNKEKEQ